MRKAFAVLLALSMVFGLGTIGLADGAEGKTTLTVWCWDDAFNGSSMRTAGELYQQSHPDVDVDVQIVADINVRFSSALIAGEYSALPDIILVQDRDLDKNMNLYSCYANLTDSGIDFTQFAPYKVQCATSGGQIYGVPFDNGVACYVYRSDLLEEAGFTAQDLTDITWDRFIEIGTAVKEKLGIPMLKVRTDAGFTLIEMMMQSAGTWYFDAEGKLNVKGNTTFDEALALYLKMQEMGIVTEVSDGEQYSAAFYDGSVMGTVNASWVLASVNKEPSLSGKWAITNVPRLNQAEGATNYSASGGCNWTVMDTSANKDIAIDFLKETLGGGQYAHEFYTRALNDASVIGSYLPMLESEAYQQPAEYYGNQPIYSTLVSYSSLVPEINLGWYTTDARTAIATAVQEIHAGASIEAAVDNMVATMEFTMAQ